MGCFFKKPGKPISLVHDYISLLGLAELENTDNTVTTLRTPA